MGTCALGCGVTPQLDKIGQPLKPADEIRLRDVTIAYGGHPAVHHISGAFSPGSLTAILGPNGAGKSSLLKGLAGLKPLSGGRIDFGTLRRQDIGYLPQQSECDRTFPVSVQDFVALGAVARVGLFRAISRSDHDRARSALARVGLQGFERRILSELSTGQFQRVLFARLIVQDTPIILLDEPFNAVDARTTDDLIAMVRDWHRQSRTVIIVLHDNELARRLCPTSLVIARDILAWGPTQDALSANVLARARQMAEAWDDNAPVCAGPDDLRPDAA